MHEYHNLYATAGGIQPVQCGFFGIHAESIDDAAMYVATDRVKQTLVLIPLTPNFFWTAARLLCSPSYQRIYIAMPTMSCRVVSDIVNMLLKFMILKKEIFFVYPEPIYGYFDMNDPVTSSLMGHCKSVSDHRVLGLDCSIHYLPLGEGSATGGYGLSLITNHGRHLFLDQVSRAKAGALLTNIMAEDSRRPYKWLSMPWRVPAYGGISMFDVVKGENYFDEETAEVFRKFTAQFKGRLVPFRFTCSEELNEARGHSNVVNVPARLVL